MMATTTCVFCGMVREDTERACREHLLRECPKIDANDREAVLSLPILED